MIVAACAWLLVENRLLYVLCQQLPADTNGMTHGPQHVQVLELQALLNDHKATCMEYVLAMCNGTKCLGNTHSTAR